MENLNISIMSWRKTNDFEILNENWNKVSAVTFIQRDIDLLAEEIQRVHHDILIEGGPGVFMTGLKNKLKGAGNIAKNVAGGIGKLARGEATTGGIDVKSQYNLDQLQSVWKNFHNDVFKMIPKDKMVQQFPEINQAIDDLANMIARANGTNSGGGGAVTPPVTPDATTPANAGAEEPPSGDGTGVGIGTGEGDAPSKEVNLGTGGSTAFQGASTSSGGPEQQIPAQNTPADVTTPTGPGGQEEVTTPDGNTFNMPGDNTSPEQTTPPPTRDSIRQAAEKRKENKNVTSDDIEALNQKIANDPSGWQDSQPESQTPEEPVAQEEPAPAQRNVTMKEIGDAIGGIANTQNSSAAVVAARKVIKDLAGDDGVITGDEAKKIEKSFKQPQTLQQVLRGILSRRGVNVDLVYDNYNPLAANLGFMGNWGKL